MNSTTEISSDKFRSFWKWFQDEGAAYLKAFLSSSVLTLGLRICRILWEQRPYWVWFQHICTQIRKNKANSRFIYRNLWTFREGHLAVAYRVQWCMWFPQPVANAKHNGTQCTTSLGTGRGHRKTAHHCDPIKVKSNVSLPRGKNWICSYKRNRIQVLAWKQGLQYMWLFQFQLLVKLRS